MTESLGMTPDRTPLESYREGIADAKALVARETATARGIEGDLERRLKHCRRLRRDAVSSARAKRDASAELGRIPIVGFLFARRKLAEAKAADAVLQRLDSRLASIISEGRKVRALLGGLSSLSNDLAAADVTARTLGYLPEKLSTQAETAGNRAIFLRARVGPSRRDVVAVSRELVEVAGFWRAAKELADRKVRKNPPSRTSADKIYLPIPVSMKSSAQRLGAKYDGEAPPGSRVFVPVGTNLAPFERMLPLAFRSSPLKLTFPPIRAGAAGQAIWGMFDRQTWDHVRYAAYERTGKRCQLCGKVSGGLKARLFPDLGRRTSQVECHEVWDWKVPDPATGVGIQKLKALLVVCFECHATFHEGFYKSVARKVGLMEQVETFIEKRRLALTRMDPAELRESLLRSSEQWKRHSEIREWVVDLSHLAAQDYMGHVEPVLLEANPAGVPAERIAGIAFVTDEGRAFPARPAETVCAEAGAPRAHQGFGSVESLMVDSESH